MPSSNYRFRVFFIISFFLSLRFFYAIQVSYSYEKLYACHNYIPFLLFILSRHLFIAYRICHLIWLQQVTLYSLAFPSSNNYSDVSRFDLLLGVRARRNTVVTISSIYFIFPERVHVPVYTVSSPRTRFFRFSG